MRSLLCLAFASSFLFPQDAHQARLEESLSEYWDALLAQNKVGAMNLVHPDDLNNFLYRKETPILSWELEKIDFHTDSSATVSVRLKTIIAGKPTQIPFQEHWERIESGWKVRITSAQEAYQKTTEAFRSAAPKLPREVSLYPPQLRIYQMARPPIGIIYLRNGLDSMVTDISVELDGSKFELVGLPEEIEPGTSEAIRVRFTGHEREENLESKALLRYQQDGTTAEFPFSIVYNYADHVTRWLSNKAPEELKKLNPKPPSQPIPKPPPRR